MHHQPGRVGIAAVHDDLHRGHLAAAKPIGEIGCQDDDPLEAARHQVRLDFHPVTGQAQREETRVAERGGQAVGFRRCLFNHQANRDAAQVQRDAIVEDEQQQQRQHDGEQIAARVAQDLQRFLAHETGDAAQPARRLRRRGHGCPRPGRVPPPGQ